MTWSSPPIGKTRPAQPIPAGNCRPLHPARKTAAYDGFTLVEVLLAVGLLALIAVTALHSRSVMIRAEHKAFRLDEGRLLMRGLVAAKRSGMDDESLRETIPGEWQLTETRVSTDLADSSGGRRTVPWRVWQLHHPGSDTTLEIAIEDLAADPAAEGTSP